MTDPADLLEQEILEFVREEYLDDGRELATETPLVSSGIVDSFSLASLRAWLEQRYGVSIPDSRATPAAFDSAAGIAALVRELQQQ